MWRTGSMTFEAYHRAVLRNIVPFANHPVVLEITKISMLSLTLQKQSTALAKEAELDHC